MSDLEPLSPLKNLPVMKPLIIYHGGCSDGAGAAYAAWKRFGEHATYRPAKYGDPAPSNYEVCGRDTFVLDFSYPREELLRMYAARDIVQENMKGSLTVLDHHKTAAADLEGLPFALFDMNRSGAMIAWQHFHAGILPPECLEYVQDRDLWTWALPNSREVSAAMHAMGIAEDFRRFDTLPKTEVLVQMGSAIMLEQTLNVKSLCKNAQEGILAGHKILHTNAPLLQSEVAGELAKGRPFGAAWYIDKLGIMRVSLRSSKEGVDVSEIAKTFGGGGHAKAAGFELRNAYWKTPFGPQG